MRGLQCTASVGFQPRGDPGDLQAWARSRLGGGGYGQVLWAGYLLPLVEAQVPRPTEIDPYLSKNLLQMVTTRIFSEVVDKFGNED